MNLRYRILKNIIKPARLISRKDNCFIRMGWRLLPGCVVRENSIIGSGSVVKGNIPDGVVAGERQRKLYVRLNSIIINARSKMKNGFILINYN